MAYIVHDDYAFRIGITNLDEILTQAAAGTSGPLSATQVRQTAEQWAQATIKGYLVSQYDIVTEFAKVNTDSTRNLQVVIAIIDIVLYTIHKTVNPRDVPQHIEDSYKATLHWLVEARDKHIVVDLLPPADETLTDPNATKDMHFPETFLNSQVKFVSKPYSDARLFDTELGNQNVIPSS